MHFMKNSNTAFFLSRSYQYEMHFSDYFVKRVGESGEMRSVASQLKIVLFAR